MILTIETIQDHRTLEKGYGFIDLDKVYSVILHNEYMILNDVKLDLASTTNFGFLKEEIAKYFLAKNPIKEQVEIPKAKNEFKGRRK